MKVVRIRAPIICIRRRFGCPPKWKPLLRWWRQNKMCNLSNSTVPSNDSFIYDEKCVQYGYLSTDMARMDAVTSEPNCISM